MRILFLIMLSVFVTVVCGSGCSRAYDPSVRIVVVLQHPAAGLSWNERGDGLELTPQEKQSISKARVTGHLEVVYSGGRVSGSPEVRIVIIQVGPLQSSTSLPVPALGSAVYIQQGGALRPVETNSQLSSLVVELKQVGNQTMFYMNYPRDMTRYGGELTAWDDNGKWRGL